MHPLKKLPIEVPVIFVAAAAFGSYELLKPGPSYWLPNQPKVENTINIGTLPNKLPKLVGEQAVNAAGIGYISYNGRSTTISEGSAVRVGANEYLTAGHMAYSKDSQPKPGLSDCQSILIRNNTIDTRTGQLAEKSNTFNENGGVNIFQERVAGTFNADQDTGATPDVALVQTNNKNASLSKGEALPDPKKTVISSTLKPGQNVYFINYEPYQGADRNPVEGALSKKAQKEKLYKPAIFGATILYQEANGDYVAVDGMKSYGAKNNTYAEKGSSGGGVYNSDGQLVGTSVVSPTYTVSPKKFIDHGIKLKDYSSYKELSYVEIQTITKYALYRLKNMLSAEPDCR